MPSHKPFKSWTGSPSGNLTFFLLWKLRMVNGMSFTTSPPWCQTLPSLTSKVTLCPVCLSTKVHYNCIGFPSLHDSFSTRFSHFCLRPYGAFSTRAPNILKWTSFSNKIYASIRVAYSSKIWSSLVFNPNFKYVSTSAVYNLPPEEKLPSKLHSHTLKSVPCLSVLSSPTNTTPSRAADDSAQVTSVMLSNSWAIQTSVAPTI